MDLVVRGVVIYVFLLIVFRIAGKRTLAQSTPFDLVLLLIISEVTQQAFLGRDYSVTGAFILIGTLIGTELLFSLLKEKFKFFGILTDGIPIIIVEHGVPLKKRMKKCKVDEDDIVEAARSNFGLERIDQIKYAILEKNGSISIIPFKNEK